ncbi:MAG: hypothetical protein QW101_03740 [Ignisphaera sp.]|uniref:Uncharacterized protein n=1 Tax=Ignisphaera aggregans TaxID=334771 RepID=A0A7J3MZY5_9CREN
MAETMWFNYRKTPLGTAVRETMTAIVGVYTSREEAEKDMEQLREILSANLKIVDIAFNENYEKMCLLDPDIADVHVQTRGRYLLVAVWSATEP